MDISFKGLFKSIDIARFDEIFSDEGMVMKFLADEKWRDGFVCRKCGHSNFCRGKTPYSRRCTRCKGEESATAHTMFHRCKIPLTEAFKIAYMVCNSPGISSREISRQMDIRQMTCCKLKKKIMECLEEQRRSKDAG